MGVSINIVNLAEGKKEVEFPEGTTVGEVAEKVDPSGSLSVQSRGQDARGSNEPVENGQTVTAQPKALKNG